MSSNPLLWSLLRPSTRPPAPLPPPPPVPENRTNTSLRVVLHDTQSALEQFSDRLGRLLDAVEHAQRGLDTVSSAFADGHDRLLEELNAAGKLLVYARLSRHNTLLLSQSIAERPPGNPRLPRTSRRPGRGQPFPGRSQSQPRTAGRQGRITATSCVCFPSRRTLAQHTFLSQQLCTISEQQGHILTSLAAVTPLAPLLKDSPQQQHQMLSMLTALLPVLQSLPAQLKASQQDTLSSVTKSIADMRRSPAVSSPCHTCCKEPCVSTPGQSTSDAVRHTASSLGSETAHVSQVQQQVTMPEPKSTNALPSLSKPLHEPKSPRRNSGNDIARDRKRQRLTLDVDHGMSPYSPGVPVTPCQTLSTRASHEQPRPGVIIGKPSRPASVYRGPTPTVRAPAVVTPVPDAPTARRPQRSMTMAPVPVTGNGFPPSTPPFARRGLPPRINMPAAAAEAASRTMGSHRNNSQQRKLLNEDADEDVDIDLDWGDMASN